jgi:hypothetical protein
MHATNFTWKDSHTVMGYHSDYEKYMMTIQDQVTPPITYKSSTLGDDPRSYLKYSATQSRQYEAKLVPEWVMHSYTGYNDEARGIASETAPRILTDSINITSQYLIAWIRQVILPWSDRGTPDAHIGVQSVLGAATYGDRPYIFTQAANTVPWLCWCDENHKWAWHKIWVTGSMTPIAARIGAAANAAGPAVFVLGENGNALANWWNATTRDLTLISCTARALPSKRTWKPSLAEARPRWATQRAFATRCRKPRRCLIAGLDSKLLQDRLKSTPYPDRLVGGYQDEPAGAGWILRTSFHGWVTVGVKRLEACLLQ